MLRDTFEDLEAGYFNIPSEVLEEHQISPWNVTSQPYRDWVKRRINLARFYFATGRDYLSSVQNLRCRIAGYTYIGRFEPVLDAIEREGYFLRREYPECKSLSVALKISLLALLQSLNTNPLESSSSTWIREER
jgi:hypothetical protein